MSNMTPEVIACTTSDDMLFKLLGEELERLLPNGRSASDEFVAELRRLPVGLRAMAATYELDVSLTLDDLGWHFGNWHHKGLAQETALGLEELGALEVALIFKEAFAIAEQYWTQLGSKKWSKWYHESPLEKALEPLNERASAILDAKDQGLFAYWTEYARKHPEKLS